MIDEQPEITPERVLTAFEQLVRSTNSSADQSELRRAIRETVMARPGEVESNWSRWFLDAGRTLGLKIDDFTASCGVAFDLAASGVTLLTWDASSKRFLLVTKGERGQVAEAWSDPTMKGSKTSARRLAKLVANREPGQSVHWIAVGAGSLRHDDNSHTHGATPLARLWQMLRPEWSDIGVVLVLAMVVGLLAMAVPIAGQQLVRTVTFGTLYQPMIVLSMMLLLFLSFMGALQALNAFVVELIQQRLFARTVADLSLRLPRSDYRALRQENGPELVNRFFEIVTVQKVVAALLVDGLALVLTTVIGMSLLAFYHPFLLGYDMLLLALLMIVVLVLGRGGTATAIRESVEKYHVVAWLQEIARCPLAFRLAGGADFALARADRLTAGYLTARRSHFRVLLRQILSLFAIQALASTTLLGLGGYLVINEQLTLGQLVAAELIVTMIVGSFAKLSKHVEGFFDLMAAMNKLGHMVDLPLERCGHSLRVIPDAPLAEIRMESFLAWSVEARSKSDQPDKPGTLLIESGHHVVVFGNGGAGKSHLADILYGLESPADGMVLLGGCDVRELTSDVLRRHVAMIRGVEIFAGTLEENIHLGRTGVDSTAIREALHLTGLDEELSVLPDGLRTVLTCDGAPLSGSQRIHLMIARAVAGRPNLLVIDGLLDGLPDEKLDSVLSNLQSPHAHSTLLLLTGRQDMASKLQRAVKLVPNHSASKKQSSQIHHDHST